VREYTTWVGLDDSAKTISVAILHGDEEQPREEFTIANDSTGLGRLVKRLKNISDNVRCVYEAGVNGYHLQRYFEQHAIRCDIAAPSLTPRQVGKRVKTDKIDARLLAKLYRAGQLTLITIPQREQESLRDLLRAREDSMEDLQRKRHRLARLLLRHGHKYSGKQAWSLRHLQWIKSVHFDNGCDQMVLHEYFLAMVEEMDRLRKFDEKIEELAAQPTYQKAAACLMALKGIKTLTAMTIIAEALDLKRFKQAPQLMAAIGVVPSEYSSGARECRGSITKTGNPHLRRVLIESAWHYRHSSVPGKTLQKRRKGLPAEVLEIAQKADKRLNKKYRNLINRGKDNRKAAVAVARELAGFIWAIGQVA